MLGTGFSPTRAFPTRVFPTRSFPTRAARPPPEGLRPLRDPVTVHRNEDDEDTGE
ncbi:hypothetical protein GCM10009864_34890 [Streptomyces lunalinharesii]|uniref:Uncharacterized protein n=1 Tax=Streptomyces lunalinharesii TaxID=333384 RepID=A0ABN3RY79_9ACTN